MKKRKPLTAEHKAKIGKARRKFMKKRASSLKNKTIKWEVNYTKQKPKRNVSLITQLKSHRKSVDNTILSLEALGVK